MNTTYEYHVVPFIGEVSNENMNLTNASAVSGQLQSEIDSHAEQGWEFQGITTVNVQVKPGCLASLFGTRASSLVFEQLIFRRPQI